MNKEFKHIQAAHCENGVATSLLRYHGLQFMTEPLAFGMGSGIFYLHIPFLTISNGPAITYRSMPGWIFSRTCTALGVKVIREKFRSEEAAVKFLDQKVKEGVPVGCQVGVFNLPYFPPEYRFHFNAHNLIVYGKENGNYLISDPVMETVTHLSEEDMLKVRFAKGPLAPKGHVYYPENVGIVTDEMVPEFAIDESPSDRRVECLRWTVAVNPYPCKTAPLLLSTPAIVAPAVAYKTWQELQAESWPVELRWQLVEGSPDAGSAA